MKTKSPKKATITISVREAAENWGLTRQRVTQFIAEGRIPGAVLVEANSNKAWRIPADAVRPDQIQRGRKVV